MCNAVSFEFSINRVYGFYDECNRRFSVRLWRNFQSIFDVMPLAGLINDRILCMHGGISPDITTDLDQIQAIKRPLDYLSFTKKGIPCDLLWADPDYVRNGWTPSIRGISNNFGPDTVKQFCTKFKLQLIIRAHQVVQEGFQFFADRKLITLFSAPNYCCEFNNRAAVIKVSQDLKLTFHSFISDFPANAVPVPHGLPGHSKEDPSDPSAAPFDP
ncbi:MAG: hypothetical protein GY696_25675 [Gammaproteobacteria bacterium]|nr:hypothetical protein [Gammaproteobacteria bacterium]